MTTLSPELEALVDRRVQEVVGQKIEAALQESGVTARKDRLALIASKGTMDMAYPPLILATTAAAMEMETAIFFTFYGLYILHKKRGPKLQVPPLANPAMPMPVPNLIGAIPGMTAMATAMMKSWMGRVKVPSIPEFLDLCLESGVRLIGCQMTMDVMGVKKEDLIDGIEIGGAATYLAYASESACSLFI